MRAFGEHRVVAHNGVLVGGGAVVGRLEDEGVEDEQGSLLLKGPSTCVAAAAKTPPKGHTEVWQAAVPRLQRAEERLSVEEQRRGEAVKGTLVSYGSACQNSCL